MISRFYTNKIKKAKPETLIDPQKQRVYKMEREFIGTVLDTTVDPRVLTEILRHACRKAGVEAPVLIIYEDEKSRVFGYQTEKGIFLNESWHGVNLGVMLHELAHWISDELYDGKVPDHGEEFCAIYRHLLDQYKLLPAECFDLLAESWAVDVGSY